MAKKGAKGDQMDLIDFRPKNSKVIIAAARLYKEYQAERLKFLAKEKEEKQRIIQLVKQGGVKPFEGGKIRFEIDSLIISITPRDELVEVLEKPKVKKVNL